MANNTVLAKMAVQISANTAEFNRALSATQKNLSSFTAGITRIAGTLGVALGVQQFADAAIEISKLAGEAEGVNAAFKRLPESTRLLKELKDATGGTVSELALMKRAVQASNFDISLEALPRLLEFATLRAQQTGQSVDYLVDSIVTGIGRKSKLILDNLGISAVQLNEALGGASTAAASIGEVADAVGEIAEDNLKNMAGFSDNAATKMQKLAASWENAKVAAGNAANGTGILGTAIDSLGKNLDVIASENIPFYLKALNLLTLGSATTHLAQLDALETERKIREERKKQEQIIREVDRAFKEFNGDIDAYAKVITQHIYKTELLAEFTKRLNDERKNEVVTIEILKAKIDELNTTFNQTDATDKAKLRNIGDEIRATEKLIEELESLKLARLSAESKRILEKPVPSRTDNHLVTGGGFLQEVGLSTNDINNQLKASLAGIDSSLIKNNESLDGWVQKAKSSLEEYEKNMIDFSGVIQGALVGIGEALGGAITGSQNLGQSLLRVLGGVLGQLGQMLITAGLGVEAFKTSLKSLNGAVAIAAGVALIALSSAVSTGIKGLGANPTGAGGVTPSSVSRNNSPRNSLPSEQRVEIDGKISGYSLDIVTSKEDYRRSRVG